MRRLIPVVCAFVLAGCYHAVIDTGRTPSTTVIQKDWAMGWIYGLIPPDVVQTAQACPRGVSKVETQHSFLNMLAQFVTFGIFTPISITVTCAQGGTALLPSIDGKADPQRAMKQAVQLSEEMNGPVLVKF
jgi:hypothetical protein